ncbi:LamG domain-containing protein [Candidatus Nanosalina sp. VS9-1]|uniref:LamG domain-containing protein n=1 Tax=Candidatus Nanosalina sp. VS9-1 TaxID=3388566 RepID=UPI0039E19AC7
MLRAYYNFEQSEGDLLDLSGNDYSSSDLSVTSRNSSGILNGNCFRFDSFTDYVNLGPNFQFSDSEEFSISFWYNRTGLDNNDRLLGFDTTAGWGFLFDKNYIDGGNDLVFRFDRTNLESKAGASENQWYHAVVTRKSSGEVKLYIDGELKASMQSSSWTTPGDDFIVGSTGRDGGVYSDDERFNGFIDELRIYDRPLTESEVSYLYGVGSKGLHVSSVKGS